ncbi:TetR/AcrR family transcriptional regulator [Pseudorhodobacter sp.]|uniref:TetR/AcrR family transcriptional regulator n=1 Tax=Pseudorhodobacter sp. TaxID=1934400 RepID=UPI002646FF1C|nr:TetR/AcrR family transcriptional regulator [Pseudorhodobacter sp.]MDN5788922.1 TetR/AcrR family transcriptional regulator [Pseudorhodobacter sp.]
MDAEVQTTRKGRKYDDVLKGAWQVFLAHGFEGANVDDIARAAGVSKATLYSYFPDKRVLFLEVMNVECDKHAEAAASQIGPQVALKDAVMIAATSLVEFFTSDFYLRVFRIVVAESERFPDLGQQFYENGPLMVRHRIVSYLDHAEAQGLVRIKDKNLAADLFTETCRADLFIGMLFGIISNPTQAEKDRVIAGAVAMFMARYAASATPD